VNIVNKLTIRHLKQNKRRTLVTIIGVIISVAMITAVATLSVSFLDLMKRGTIAKEGEWHVLYQNANNEQYEGIRTDKETKAAAISRDLGYSYLESGQNENKPYLFLKGFDEQGFNMFPIEISEGRLPQAENEIVLSEAVALNGKVKYDIGDTLTLKIGKRFNNHPDNGEIELTQNDPLANEEGEVIEELRTTNERTFKIVGFIKRPEWEPTWSPGYTSLVYVDSSDISETDPVNVSVQLQKVNNQLYEHAEELASKYKIDSFGYNDDLLRYYGVTDNDNLRKTLYSLTAIIMAVIIVGSVALIYNAFAISVSERARHLGMLASVGATKRQKRNSVFFEGFIIAVISIPIGIVSGLLGIGITFHFINSMIQNTLGTTEELTVLVTLFSILGAVLVSVLTIFISTYLPAKRASKITAIDAIRQTMDVKLTGKKVKTNKLVRKVFGIEAEIALKNLKRNKRRYQVTVFSLVISIVLFLAVSFFTENLRKSTELSQDGINFDIQVSFDTENTDNIALQQSILSLKNVTHSTVIKELNVLTWVEEEMLAEDLKEDVKLGIIELEDGKYQYYVKINSLDDDALKEYAKEVGADYSELVDPTKLGAIIIDRIRYEDYEQMKVRKINALYTEVGESLELFDFNGENEKMQVGQVEAVSLTDKVPYGMFPAGLGGVNIIVSEDVLNRLAKEGNLEIHKFLYLNSSKPMKTQSDIEDLKAEGIDIYNVYQAKQQEEQMITIMSVFTYGFIALITLISVANIFNTISTSISLRKREFAMMKSVGMTPKGFNRMLNFESIFYGIKSLLYGLPISIAVMFLIHRSLMNSFAYEFTFPWISTISVIVAVFVIVMLAMLYSISKVKKENIIDAIKQESI
jgi:putative ABC transport system permease protein